jgi:hypothetical protein
VVRKSKYARRARDHARISPGLGRCLAWSAGADPRKLRIWRLALLDRNVQTGKRARCAPGITGSGPIRITRSAEALAAVAQV